MSLYRKNEYDIDNIEFLFSFHSFFYLLFMQIHLLYQLQLLLHPLNWKNSKNGQVYEFHDKILSDLPIAIHISYLDHVSHL